METILEGIIAAKRREVAEARAAISLQELGSRLRGLEPCRDFYAAVARPGGSSVQLIAEIKRASPSAGLIIHDFDPVRIAQAYHRHGAAALSVLTDSTYFQGRLEHIERVKKVVPLPILRKDFVLEEYQLYESRVAGADCLLLIVEVLGAERIAAMLPICRELGIGALVEVHQADNLEALLAAAGSPGRHHYLLGINNRDLVVQRTNLQTTIRLASMLPMGTAFVSESGIARREDVEIVQQAGACAILVGESLLRADDIGAQISFLMGRTEAHLRSAGLEHE